VNERVVSAQDGDLPAAPGVPNARCVVKTWGYHALPIRAERTIQHVSLIAMQGDNLPTAGGLPQARRLGGGEHALPIPPQPRLPHRLSGFERNNLLPAGRIP